MGQLTTEYWLALQKRWGVAVKQFAQGMFPSTFPMQGLTRGYFGSSTCCGVAEIGSWFGLGDQTVEDYLVDQIACGLRYAKGLLLFYMPPVSHHYARHVPTLRKYGFTEGRRFYNPNSGHDVVEWSLELQPISNYV